METSQLLEVIRRHTCQLLLMITLLSCTGCVSMLRIDGPYEGKVIDADTNQPIEGAVVHGTWYKIDPTPAGRYSQYYDSAEMLTDRNGEFKIPGKGILVLSSIDNLILTIFKAGYKQFPVNSSWRGLKKYGPFDKVSWKGDKATIKLKRLTMEERLKSGVTEPDSPNRKQRLFIIERNKEMLEIGYPSSTLLPVE